eukprot:TRINITY_DN7600_c0_g1_i1.p1 TRINITY_DN7600_c0_g1~~TRINITY_DN7600_c0_g1_i1.p1  ORF type:complete len:608 (+),score=137.22 TRINITY_DN7600_c0_g1_i1:278-2101(+)
MSEQQGRVVEFGSECSWLKPKEKSRSPSRRRKRDDRSAYPQEFFNVCSFSATSLDQVLNPLTEPSLCPRCQSSFSSNSLIIDTLQEKFWKCEYCGNLKTSTINEEDRPKEGECIDYVLEDPGDEVVKDKLFIYCVDISTSMTDSLPTIMEGIIEEIEALKEFPKTSAVVIGFSQNLIAVSTNVNTIDVESDLAQSGSDIADSLATTEEFNFVGLSQLSGNDQRCLGSALSLATNISKQFKQNTSGFSSIVVIANGLTNHGLGRIENIAQDETQHDPALEYYRSIGNQAAEIYTPISLLSLGELCNIEILSTFVSETGGLIDRIDINTFTKDNILRSIREKTKIVALDVQINLKISSIIRLRSSYESNLTFPYLTASSQHFWEYCFEDRNRNDTSPMPGYLPFQLQITHQKPSGGKYMRILVGSQMVTPERDECELYADIPLLGAFTIRNITNYCLAGKYHKASNYVSSQRKYLKRACNSVYRKELDQVLSKIDSLSKIISNERAQEKEEDSELTKIYKEKSGRRKSRSRSRSPTFRSLRILHREHDDKFALEIYKLKNFSANEIERVNPEDVEKVVQESFDKSSKTTGRKKRSRRSYSPRPYKRRRR